MTEQAHAEFETWWARQPHREQFEDVKDQMRNVAVAFYQKGLEGLVVKLPEEWDVGATGPQMVMDSDEVKAAIEAAGAKWKE